MRRRPSRTCVHVVPVQASRLVTLEDPDAAPEAARGAFARLRPPEGTSPEVIASWRASVARVARAVKVLAAPRSEEVPAASTRVDAEEKVGSLRQETLALARATENPFVVDLTKKLLDEAGVP